VQSNAQRSAQPGTSVAALPAPHPKPRMLADRRNVLPENCARNPIDLDGHSVKLESIASILRPVPHSNRAHVRAAHSRALGASRSWVHGACGNGRGIHRRANAHGNENVLFLYVRRLDYSKALVRLQPPVQEAR
jgi:hypothetical protein